MGRKKTFGSSKRYADVLTFLLVIIIIAIFGLLGYFGYKAIHKQSIETNVSKALEEFNKNLDENQNEQEDENVVVAEGTDEVASSDLSSLINTTIKNETPSTSNSTSSSSSNVKKTYLGDYEIKGTISIPKTGIEYPILDKVTVDSLAQSVAILSIVSSDELNETVKDLNVAGSNALILGHNYRNGLFFSDNDKLSNGDKIKIKDQTGNTVTYTIYSMFYTSANDISFMERSIDVNTREITLQTCNDDSSQRLIIQAKDN
jgi:LPXTG-site transpeptidase (sortase) family protein